jgi:hypothetical protein
MGNSDHSMPRARRPATSLSAAAPLWQSFVRQLTKGDPVAAFRAPKGIVKAKIDAWSGGKPGSWTRDTRTELFRSGTQPGGKREVDRAGLLYARACGTWVVDPVKAELGPKTWDADVADWLRRARRGTGVEGPYGSKTAYSWGRNGWGGRLAGPCPAPKPKPDKPDKPDKPENPGKPDPPDKPEEPVEPAGDASTG